MFGWQLADDDDDDNVGEVEEDANADADDVAEEWGGAMTTTRCWVEVHVKSTFNT